MDGSGASYFLFSFFFGSPFESSSFAAIFVSGQLISQEERGLITEADLTGLETLDSRQQQLAEAAIGEPGNSSYLSEHEEKENRIGARPVAFLMWPSGAGHESFMCQSLSILLLPLLLTPLLDRLFVSSFFMKSQGVDAAASYRSAESVNRRVNVFWLIVPPLPPNNADSIVRTIFLRYFSLSFRKSEFWRCMTSRTRIAFQ